MAAVAKINDRTASAAAEILPKSPSVKPQHNTSVRTGSAFVLTHHTPHTHKCMNKSRCAHQLIRGNTHTHLHYFFQQCTRSAGHFITPLLPANCPHIYTFIQHNSIPTNTLTLSASIPLGEKEISQNEYCFKISLQM